MTALIESLILDDCDAIIDYHMCGDDVLGNILVIKISINVNSCCSFYGRNTGNQIISLFVNYLKGFCKEYTKD